MTPPLTKTGYSQAVRIAVRRQPPSVYLAAAWIVSDDAQRFILNRTYPDLMDEVRERHSNLGGYTKAELAKPHQ